MLILVKCYNNKKVLLPIVILITLLIRQAAAKQQQQKIKLKGWLKAIKTTMTYIKANIGKQFECLTQFENYLCISAICASIFSLKHWLGSQYSRWADIKEMYELDEFWMRQDEFDVARSLFTF